MHRHIVTSNTILYCSKWEETCRFYRDRLGLPVLFDTDWFVEYRLNAGSRLSIADERRATIRGCGGSGMTIALEVSEIDAVWARMERMGLNPTAIREHPWNARVFYLVDPEGHRVEIWQSLSAATGREPMPAGS